MGSLSASTNYPDASDHSLVLAHPTAAEKEQTWRLNHGEWGGALDQAAYLQREQFLASTALAANGGMLHWILTEASAVHGPDKKRSVLASCETIRKRVLYALPPSLSQTGDGDGVREGLSYGIGSVYTYPEFRGKKYAARMLTDLGAVLKTWPKEEQLRKKRAQARGPEVATANGSQAAEDAGTGAGTGEQEAACSALWSDIGKRFYASKGWPVFASEHVEFPSHSSPSHPPPGIASLLERPKRPHDASLTLTPVTTRNIARLCADDEAQLRRELVAHARGTRRTAFAFTPEPDVFRWHWAREEFIASRVFPDRPLSEVRGMIATVAEDRKGEEKKKTRMWAVWTRNYGADAASNAAKNTLYILRIVIENNNYNDTTAAAAASTLDPEAHQLAFDAIMHSALDAARAWHCGAVHLWNPTLAVRGLIARCGLAHKFVDREVDSIPSLMWYGPKDEREEGKAAVDWIANEKYCWC
ncbi:hypothetical protein GGS24DRAFT_413742 [Hypoxylon argillaceum]|nr:hypothetical protein GGS24DRAFT_413742 [Hypoxylon argillaceum]